MTTPQTQPYPPQIEAAAAALAAILAGDLDVELRLRVASTLTVLCDVQPPYPPLPEPAEPLVPAAGLPRAREHLAAAAEEATTVAEAMRIGLAAREMPPEP